MTARRTHRVDEATLLDLLMKGDYAGFAELTGATVDEIERALDGWDDRYDTLDDEEEDDCFFNEEKDGEDGDALAWRPFS